MIGGDALRAGRSLLLVLAIVAAFGSRAADPAAADPPVEATRATLLREVIAAADAALADLEAVLRSAGEAGRRGSALAVAGQAPPGPALGEAADALQAISLPHGPLAVARMEASRVAGTLRSILPRGPALPDLAITADTLLGMAAQLRAGAPAADRFAMRRQQSEAAGVALADAVAALDADAPTVALGHLDELDRVLADLRGWFDAPGSFSAWLGVIGEFGAASRGLAEASLVGDSDALEVAARRYAGAAAAARGADQALGLAISEGGAAIAATPLRRLADALDSLAELRNALGLVPSAAASTRIGAALYSLAG